MNLLLIGGDKRQVIIKNNLEKSGFSVDHICYNADLNNDFSRYDAIIFPLPTTRDGVFVTNSLSGDKIKISDISSKIIEQTVLCGNYSFDNFLYYDYGKDEATTILNAVPTAEGAIAIAINNTSFTLWKSKCLVVGYGKIGKALSSRLKNLGSYVTVSARRDTDFAFIDVNGYRAVKTNDIIETANEYDIIFNTVPTPVLPRNVLKKCHKDCLLIELSSPPYGIDLKAAEELGLNVIMAGGLPGKVAPKTAADILSSSIIKFLNQESNTKR